MAQKFDWKENKRGAKPPAPVKKVPVISDARCKVCSSSHRHLIDELLVAGVSYSEIERQFAFASIPRRSISRHSAKHLGYQEAAIRHIIEREATKAQKNYDEGVDRAVTKMAYLEVALNRGFEQILRDDIEITVGEAVKLIELKHKMEKEVSEEAVDELRSQFNAFMQATKEIVPQEYWERVRDRTFEIVKAEGYAISIGEDKPELVEAEVVDETIDEALSGLNGSPDKPHS